MSDTEKWLVLQDGDMFKVVDSGGRVMARDIPDHALAIHIAEIHSLVNVRYRLASIINTLAIYVLNSSLNSNERDLAEDQMDKVRKYLQWDGG